jgi:hypothetical protein
LETHPTGQIIGQFLVAFLPFSSEFG